MLKVGDEVEWVSSVRGRENVKRGLIEACIAPGESPTREQRREADAFGRPRDHWSYLVRVPVAKGNGKGSLYWPRPSGVRPVATGIGETLVRRAMVSLGLPLEASTDGGAIGGALGQRTSLQRVLTEAYLAGVKAGAARPHGALQGVLKELEGIK